MGIYLRSPFFRRSRRVIVRFKVILVLLCFSTVLTAYVLDRLEPTSRLREVATFTPGHAKRKLNERALTPEDAIKKGRGLICKVINFDKRSIHYPLQSIWTNPNQLGDFGWLEEPYPGTFAKTLKYMTPALLGLDLSTDQANWELASDSHVKSYSLPSTTKTLQPTGAYFITLLNSKQGSFMCIDNRAPRQTNNVIRWGYPVPPLERLSDNLFLHWLRAAGPDPGQVAALKYIFRYHVINKDTLEIVRGLEKRDGLIGLWPGRIFPISDSETETDGLSLLGTPNGAAIAFLLYQHKDYFPRKTIKQVQIFKTKGEGNTVPAAPWVHMIFYIDDLPQPSSPDPSKLGCCSG